MTNTLKALEPSRGANAAVPKAARTLRAAASALMLLLLPKCPLCVGAYLMGLGISASVASSAAPFVRPVAFLLATISWLALLGALWRSRKRRASAPLRPDRAGSA